jgi:hypothetical protein
MMKGREDFYHEDYRSVAGQFSIIKLALEVPGDTLRQAAEKPSNRWEHNVAVYLEAVASDKLDEVRVRELRVDAGVSVTILAALEPEAPIQADQELQKPNQVDVAVEEEEEDKLTSRDHLDGRWLVPRSQQTFYGTILGKTRLWQRPPDDNCKRCNDFETNSDRIRVLTTALTMSPQHPEASDSAEIVRKAGGQLKAWAEKRNLDKSIQDLLRHVTWKAKQRAFLKAEEGELQPHQALLELDYGGFTDSDGKKISCWSATVITCGREQEHFDFFFDAANQVTSRPGAKKNGKTGVFFLKELFSPDRAPAGVVGSVFSSRYPDVTELVFSGDTGNGYRAYEMLEYLSTFEDEHGYKVKLIPLSPGHAYNRTDGRFAHMNTFGNAAKKVARIFGAEELAAAFHLASDPTVATMRKYMARSWVFFRVVVGEDDLDGSEGVYSDFGPSQHSGAMEGILGVKGLLYFDFNVKGIIEGSTQQIPGYARVRAHADPNLPNNPTFLFTWRKDLQKEMCQSCSDRAVRICTHQTLPPVHNSDLHHLCRCVLFCSRCTGAPKQSAR